MHVWSLNIQPAVNIIMACLHNGFLDVRHFVLVCHINSPNPVLI